MVWPHLAEISLLGGLGCGGWLLKVILEGKTLPCPVFPRCFRV